MIGLSRGTVQVVPYQTCWPELFGREAARIRFALGSVIGRIEHIGSTAVPGLNAKPIIDILAGVESLAAARNFIGAFEQLGYEHHPDNPIAGRLFFTLGPASNRTHYVSLAEEGSRFWNTHIAFRDHLRLDADAASRYATLKQQLAARYADERSSYTAAKEAFIAKILSALNRNA